MNESGKTRGERGIALVLALMALLLLTAIAMTLAMSSALEVQSAVNYRWSRKAYYNAESGVAVGRVVLGEMTWAYALPPARPPWRAGDTPWRAPLPAAASGSSQQTRDYEMAACDVTGNGMGYGLVLADEATTYQDVNEVAGQTFDGAFTLWVRRPLVYQPDGRTADYPYNDVLILVSEGVAPSVAPGQAMAQAAQVIEVTLHTGLQGVMLGPPAFPLTPLDVALTTTPFKVGSSVCR
jgi:hypothetical protein